MCAFVHANHANDPELFGNICFDGIRIPVSSVGLLNWRWIFDDGLIVVIAYATFGNVVIFFLVCTMELCLLSLHPHAAASPADAAALLDPSVMELVVDARSFVKDMMGNISGC